MSAEHSDAPKRHKKPQKPIAANQDTDDLPKHVVRAIEWLSGAIASGEDVLDDERIQLKDFTFSELRTIIERGFGEKKFRAQQIYSWLYQHLATETTEMTNLSKGLRQKLDAYTKVSPMTHQSSHVASDGTTKLTFKCRDNSVVETVFIPSEGRNTLCISSQVGCAMGCTFCWTAKMGLFRNLTAAEIVDQVVQARRLMNDVNGHIGNIVFMGMGEPLHNYNNVVRAIHVLTDQKGLDFSRRKITVSTSGLVPALKKLGNDVDVNIAISLNATTDEQRSSIMPVNDRWDIKELMQTLKDYPLEKRQRITFEYVMIKDLNDSDEDIKRLANLVKGVPCKINLIPFNPHPESPFQPPTEEVVDRFKEQLSARNISCFRRVTRGQDEMAACGQLGEPGDKPEPPHVRKRLERFREQNRQSAARDASASKGKKARAKSNHTKKKS